MAYNYFPVTYPYLQQPQPQSSIIWVSGDAEAEAYPIAPNNAVRLWHSSLPIVYFKTADASGRPTLKSYDLVERAQVAQKSVSGPSSIDGGYATKKELEALSTALEELRKKVEHE